MKHAITYFEIAAFITSLLAWPYLKKKEHNYLRLFPLLLFIIVIVEVQQTFFRKPGEYNAPIYNLQVPLQHMIYLYILYGATKKPRYKKFLIVMLVAFIVLAVVTGAFFTEPNRFNILAYCIGSVMIIVGIFLNFYEMLNNPTTFDFLKNPFFYMLTAFLLFNLVTLPYFTMSNSMHFIGVPENIKQDLINLMSVFNYILYSTYTIVFLWMIHRVILFSSPQR